MPYSMTEQTPTVIEEIWVNTSEATELTGYFHTHVRKLARDNWALPEEQRAIRIRRRAGRYDIWLPDLVKYMKERGTGPQPGKHKPR